MPQTTSKTWRSVSIRVVIGLGLAAVLYHAAANLATTDCMTTRLSIHAGGLLTLGRLIGVLVLLLVIGLPLPFAAIASGLLTSPMTGAGLTSLAMVLALSLCFALGRLAGRDHFLVQKFERWATGRLWFSDLMATRANSGMRWASEHTYESPIQLSLFASYCGAAIRHLTLPAFLAGTFVSTLPSVIAYALAGGNIGCAIVDHAHGFPTQQYIVPVLLSVAALLIVAKLRPRLTL